MRRREESVRPAEKPDPEAFLPLPNLPFQVLLALAEAPRHGWGIIKRVEALCGPRAKPSSGSLYLAIARLEERGLVAVVANSPAVDGTEAPRTYELTDLGRQVLSLETIRLAALVRAAGRSLGLAPENSLGDAR
jgi:DNA-binding PadR family transcriptional regulator